MSDFTKPYMVMHPDDRAEAQMAASLKEAEIIAEIMALDYGPAVVNIYSLTKISTVDCLVGDEEVEGSVA